ncbi:MAG TPA: RNB domain-containing ribonuclease [Dissulfurispiraceae bacterium]|nr:RNB domain-containing ribonuclease [Dissulfurispiraceae bacterium]
MINQEDKSHRNILQQIARLAMLERGLLPDFSTDVISELTAMKSPAIIENDGIRDLKNLLWASIDNDDSRDLDQLTVAESMQDGNVKIYVAIADVDSLVLNNSAIDTHARHNTTSIYTAAQIFPMLPERLSTDLTSLNYGEDRPAIVVEYVVTPDGSLTTSDVYQAVVYNYAKLAYNGVSDWLDGKVPIPAQISSVKGLDENLKLQDRVAQSMKKVRRDHGALTFETIKANMIFEGDEIREMQPERKNRARDLIEDFMIAANGVIARYLSSKNVPSIRRIVRIPERWDRIAEIAADHGFTLPDTPDAVALEKFLTAQKESDPLRFPDLSLVIIKLMGAGEYVADMPGDSVPGHFALAVNDYAHSTAPNRRYPDLITQRLLKASLENKKMPYSNDELQTLAKHCTEEEDAVKKVERQVSKSAAALLLESRIGEKFDAIITGASEKGTWARLLAMPVEGRLIQGFKGSDVGHRIRVQLVNTDVEKGFIDFKKVN